MTAPRPEAPFTCSASFVGKGSHGALAAGTAKAHLDYITRKSALTALVAVGAALEGAKSVAAMRAIAKTEIDRKADSRANARVIDKVVLGIPYEVPTERRTDLMRAFILDLAGVRDAADLGEAVALVAIHGDPGNPHGHVAIMDGKEPKAAARRRAKATGAQRVRQRDTFRLSDQDAVERVRESWERVANRFLEDLGVTTRIDRRSLAARGVDRIPTAHEGPNRRAIVEKIRQTQGPAAAEHAIDTDPRMETMRANRIAQHANAIIRADADRTAALQAAEKRAAEAEAAAQRDRHAREEAEARAEQNRRRTAEAAAERAHREKVALADRAAKAEDILQRTEATIGPIAASVTAPLKPADPLPARVLTTARASYLAGVRTGGAKAAERLAKATQRASRAAERADEWEAEALERGRLAEEATRYVNKLSRNLEDEREAKTTAEARATAAEARAATAEAERGAARAHLTQATQNAKAEKDRADRTAKRFKEAQDVLDAIAVRTAGGEAKARVTPPRGMPLPDRIANLVDAVRRSAYQRGLTHGRRQMRDRAFAIARWLWNRVLTRREEAEQAKAIITAALAGNLIGRGPDWLSPRDWFRMRAISNGVRTGAIDAEEPKGPAKIYSLDVESRNFDAQR